MAPDPPLCCPSCGYRWAITPRTGDPAFLPCPTCHRPQGLPIEEDR